MLADIEKSLHKLNYNITQRVAYGISKLFVVVNDDS